MGISLQSSVLEGGPEISWRIAALGAIESAVEIFKET